MAYCRPTFKAICHTVVRSARGLQLGLICIDNPYTATAAQFRSGHSAVTHVRPQNSNYNLMPSARPLPAPGCFLGRCRPVTLQLCTPQVRGGNEDAIGTFELCGDVGLLTSDLADLDIQKKAQAYCREHNRHRRDQPFVVHGDGQRIPYCSLSAPTRWDMGGSEEGWLAGNRLFISKRWRG